MVKTYQISWVEKGKRFCNIKEGNFEWTHVISISDLGIHSLSISSSFSSIRRVPIFGEKLLTAMIPCFGSSFDVFPILWHHIFFSNFSCMNSSNEYNIDSLDLLGVSMSWFHAYECIISRKLIQRTTGVEIHFKSCLLYQ